VTDLHAAQLAGQIEADHVYAKVKIPGRWLRRKVCTLCQRPAPCAARQRAVDIRAGRVDATGRPVARIPRQRRPATWVDF
jgi:hypothetical protein